jgi:hypothetical protein
MIRQSQTKRVRIKMQKSSVESAETARLNCDDQSKYSNLWKLHTGSAWELLSSQTDNQNIDYCDGRKFTSSGYKRTASIVDFRSDVNPKMPRLFTSCVDKPCFFPQCAFFSNRLKSCIAMADHLLGSFRVSKSETTFVEDRPHCLLQSLVRYIRHKDVSELTCQRHSTTEMDRNRFCCQFISRSKATNEHCCRFQPQLHSSDSLNRSSAQFSRDRPDKNVLSPDACCSRTNDSESSCSITRNHEHSCR